MSPIPRYSPHLASCATHRLAIHHPWLWLLAFRLVTSVQLASLNNEGSAKKPARRLLQHQHRHGKGKAEKQNNTETQSRRFLQNQYRQGPNRPMVAMLTTGLVDRFIWKSKLTRVVVPVIQQGHGIDVYIQLVASGGQTAIAWKAGAESRREVSPDFDPTRLETNLLEEGGRLMSLEIFNKSENVYLPPNGSWEAQDKVMYQYSPYKTKAGVNVVRRYQALYGLIEKLQVVETRDDFRYTWILVTRDDDFWLGDLDLSVFYSQQQKGVVFSKDCLNWGGMNDKTLLFGRNAATTIITAFANDWWKQGEVENAEQLLLMIANRTGMVSVPVPIKQLPTSDAMYERSWDGISSTLCLRSFYECDYIKDTLLETERPPSCESELL